MAELVRRGGPSLTRWDPFGVMEALSTGFEPFRALERWFPFAGPREEGVTYTPRFDVMETKEGYVFKADLPGIKEEDLDVSVSGSRLTVSGKREYEERHEGERYYCAERSYGSFTRTFTLPEGIDPGNIEANLRDGVLTLMVPKKETEQPRKISLKGLREKISEKVKA